MLGTMPSATKKENKKMGDILDKRNRSVAPYPTQNASVEAGVLKREKFSWANPGPAGTFMMIAKEELHVDDTYQREEVSRQKVLTIARDFDWKLFGVVSVVMRENGSLWIYDGGHRTRATFYRDDITEIPCMVFDSTGVQSEAKAFIGKAKLKSNVSAYHTYRASVVAGEPVALQTNAILEKHGYRPSNDSDTRFGLNAIGTLQSMVKQSPERADKIFELCVDIGEDGEQPKAEVMRGLFELHKKLDGKVNILNGEIRKKLKIAGIEQLRQKIKNEKYISGIGGARIEAKAILDYINKGRKKKIIMGTD